jgi:hypothetical protein
MKGGIELGFLHFPNLVWKEVGPFVLLVNFSSYFKFLMNERAGLRVGLL